MILLWSYSDLIMILFRSYIQILVRLLPDFVKVFKKKKNSCQPIVLLYFNTEQSAMGSGVMNVGKGIT